MFLPELYIPAPTTQIVAEGIVVRVERRAGGKGQSGFAVVSDDLSLERIARRLNHQPGLW